MAPSFQYLASAASLAAVLPTALAGFDATSQENVAVYWGQNSYNQATGNLAQQRLSYYCDNDDIDIIPLAFMDGITPASTNFANAGNNCTKFADNANVLSCPQIEADINTCQSKGKTITISLGGSTYYQGGWQTTTDAQNAAQLVWNMFGTPSTSSNSSADRPFGTAVVDGFDFDFENPVSNLPAFAAELRSLMNASGKTMYLSAAPQCVFPDSADGAALNAVSFDFVMVQFYNNWCGNQNYNPSETTQNAFNFDVWDNWAKNTSTNKNVKVLLGMPASSTAAGSGYTNGTQLSEVIAYSKSYSSFGGAMLWDMSQLYANAGYLEDVVTDLAAPANGTGTTGDSTGSGGSTGGGTVAQWGQCGGEGYTGPTQCVSPYKCVSTGTYWSQCE
ncbi:chitinase [Xylariaceae sp. FL0255]|nr:chitinase [Xylariaceae sp. FL0255]